MKIIASTKSRYVPEFNGNRDLDPTEQIAVEIQHPTQAEREFYNGFAQKENVYLKSYIGKFVTKIENLSETRDGKDVPILTGADLITAYSADLWPLVYELFGQIFKNTQLDAETRGK